MPDSVLKSIQIDATDRLLADPYFANSIPVLNENLLDLESQVEIAVAGVGAFVLLVTPVSSVRNFKDAPGPYFDSINIVCRCHENVTLNRGSTGTQKTCLAIAEHVLAVLHGYQPSTVAEQITASDPSIMMVPDPNGLLVYDVNLQTRGGLNYTIETVPDVVVSVSGGAATLSCSLAGAAIFYTVNGGGYPSPRSGLLYSAPFSAPAGTIIKARAWLAGYLTSKQVTYRVT